MHNGLSRHVFVPLLLPSSLSMRRLLLPGSSCRTLLHHPCIRLFAHLCELCECCLRGSSLRGCGLCCSFCSCRISSGGLGPGCKDLGCRDLRGRSRLPGRQHRGAGRCHGGGVQLLDVPTGLCRIRGRFGFGHRGCPCPRLRRRLPPQRLLLLRSRGLPHTQAWSLWAPPRPGRSGLLLVMVRKLRGLVRPCRRVVVVILVLLLLFLPLPSAAPAQPLLQTARQREPEEHGSGRALRPRRLDGSQSLHKLLSCLDAPVALDDDASQQLRGPLQLLCRELGQQRRGHQGRSIVSPKPAKLQPPEQ
mmetsp:Transcript_33240/g.105796  ORF Transcript_33240/g.105796 Transcript_33240/m.105796 type:complete len:304 (+) Transcript_33240:948-1859(+)